ncbi:hypothetical protein BC941DRAFT_425016 [Chlamydoabsidia padenii]|nr:hypothetical protein BC941DRAFT_425016 [Chlamydoabsidia padenii]
MDPGYKLLQHIRTMPNLINEDPSITTPKNTSFMDLPWSELSILLNQNKRRTSAASTDGSDYSSEDESVQDSLWDANTGYQYLDKAKSA